MKKYVENKSEETTDELSNWVGIVLEDEVRGVILFTGKKHHIICTNTAFNNMYNCTCGDETYDGDNVKDTLDKWENNQSAGNKITAIYCFDTYKELMTWFVEGMKD